jgi:hypothetical protein
MNIEPFSWWVNKRNPGESFFPPRAWILIACSIVLTVAGLSCTPFSSGPQRSADEKTSGSVLSANRLYREFKDNPVDATHKYQGKTVALEGRVGQIIPLDHGEAAVHFPDEEPNSIIATFPRQDDLRGIQAGDKIQLQCAFDKYADKRVLMSFCTLAPQVSIGPEPAIVASNVPSANLLYREYEADEKAASAKHDGTIVEIEARRGDQIHNDDGSVTIHIAEAGNSNALIANFPDSSEVNAVEAGELFRLRCRVKHFDYRKLWLEACQMR